MSQDVSNHPVPEAFAKQANLTPEKYAEMYKASVEDPESFWAEHGKRIEWMEPFTQVKDVSWDKKDLHCVGEEIQIHELFVKRLIGSQRCWKLSSVCTL